MSKVEEHPESVLQGSEIAPEPVKVFSLGSAFLYKFGNTWISLETIEVIEFNIDDDNAAEVKFKGSKTTWNITEEDATLIEAYLEKRANKAS